METPRLKKKKPSILNLKGQRNSDNSSLSSCLQVPIKTTIVSPVLAKTFLMKLAFGFLSAGKQIMLGLALSVFWLVYITGGVQNSNPGKKIKVFSDLLNLEHLRAL